MNNSIMIEETPNFESCDYLPGHTMQFGKDAGKEKNDAYFDKNTNIVYINCNENYYTLIDVDDYNYTLTIDNRPITWYKMETGYVCCYITNELGTRSYIYLHDYILRRQTPKPGADQSVDHINGNKLDNRKCNLRWATQALQNQNMDKRKRKYNAKALPDELDIIIHNCKEQFSKFNIVDKSKGSAFQLWVNSDENNLPKYVEYCDELYNKEKGLRRQFFRINKHPSKQTISSSKAGTVSLEEKFNDIIHKLQILEEEHP